MTGVLSEIIRLKKEKNAFILAHNYQMAEIQDVADYVGDSLGMARKASEIENPVLVVCGVYFMAETAAILNPKKTVLIPDLNAGCPLAGFADAEMVRKWKKDYPDHAFVAYVNSSAEVKAEVDVCCTSSNAVKVVRTLPQKNIVFLPDKNLGAFVQTQVPEKKIVLWPGYCVVHETADLESIIKVKLENPQALTIAHPECPADILSLADGICSTGQMFGYIRSHPQVKDFIIITEWGIHHALKKEFSDKNFIEPSKRLECKNMKKITPDKLLRSLQDLVYAVNVPEAVSVRALSAIQKMLAITE